MLKNICTVKHVHEYFSVYIMNHLIVYYIFVSHSCSDTSAHPLDELIDFFHFAIKR
jgi:hypothetical protein